MDILSDDKEKGVLYYISEIIGWIYFAAWSFSFYGQVIENFRRKSVSGLNFDFEMYNLVGFSMYTTYTIWGYIDTNLGTGAVSIPDICFAVHALVLTLVTIGQIIYYYDKNDPDQKVSSVAITIISVLVWGALLLIIVEYGLHYADPHPEGHKYVFNSLIYMGWAKVLISLIKYNPQVYSNWKRKSTIGWNIHNILLDFTGGLFSILQMIVDTIRGNKIINGGEQSRPLNIAKFAIGFVAIFYDIIFIIQHYCLYKDSNTDIGKRSSKDTFIEEGKENIIPEEI